MKFNQLNEEGLKRMSEMILSEAGCFTQLANFTHTIFKFEEHIDVPFHPEQHQSIALVQTVP